MTLPETALTGTAVADALLGCVTDLLLVLDPVGVIRYASPSHQVFLGTAPTTLLGSNFLEGIHKDDRAPVQAAIAGVLAWPETPSTVSYRLRDADGAWRTVTATLYNRMNDPLPVGIVVVGRDQTAGNGTSDTEHTAAKRLQALQTVTEAALAHLSLDDLLRHVLECVTDVLQVDNTAILLLDGGGQELRLHVARGPEEAVAGQVRVPIGQGVAGRIAATQEPLIIDDMARAHPANPFLREHIRSLLGVPLRVTGRAFGVLHVGTLGPHRFTTDDLHWLQLVADRVALAIDHASLFEAERAAREQAAAQARELEAVFDAIGDAVFVYDAEGRLHRANAAAHALNHNLNQPSYLAEPLAVRVNQATPRDAQGRPVAAEDVPIARALRGERFLGAEAIDSLVHVQDGRDVLLNVTGAPIRDSQGRIVGGVIVNRDVTERRRLEQRTHEALDTLLAMAQTLVQASGTDEPAEKDHSGGQRRVGQRLVELTRDLLGCRRVALAAFDRQGKQHPLAVAGLSPNLEQAWWDGTEGAAVNDPRDSADPRLVEHFMAGEVILVDMTQPPLDTLPNPFGIHTLLSAPLRVDGNLIGRLSLDYDGDAHEYTPEEVALTGAVAQLAALILERERLLHERAEAQAAELALLEVNRRMDEFLAIAGHELRTPLTSILGSLQLLGKRLHRAQAWEGESAADLAPSLASVRELVRRAEAQSIRLKRMVTDLLDVSRVQTGQLGLHRNSCDIVGVTRLCVEELRVTWDTRTITLEAEDEEVFVHADADRIRQVVANFVTNALKYSAPDRPVVVAVRRERDTVRVQVRDQGPGLTDEQQRTIWERYRRVQAVPVLDDSRGIGGGLGLGLYVSRTIIQDHGGAVGVESTPGVGSTFWFTLGLAEPDGELHPSCR